jgi:hypothetical protein
MARQEGAQLIPSAPQHQQAAAPTQDAPGACRGQGGHGRSHPRRVCLDEIAGASERKGCGAANAIHGIAGLRKRDGGLGEALALVRDALAQRGALLQQFSLFFAAHGGWPLSDGASPGVFKGSAPVA